MSVPVIPPEWELSPVLRQVARSVEEEARNNPRDWTLPSLLRAHHRAMPVPEPPAKRRVVAPKPPTITARGWARRKR